ncbi:hemolymph lipopolysaccharide-binding protein-like [Bacillus rossius redtenbacheri]|uniref:hemolymph lipopolysaccharide-binding protein-like n=1 Tax=Bacillus rossius redtenbacheri TaxID=93214 RepID=UPI002FDE8003
MGAVPAASALAALLCVSCVVRPSRGATCGSPTADMKLTIISRRNLTGHWEASLSLQHGTSDEKDFEDKSTGPFELDLKHETAMCGGKQVIRIGATVTVPPRRAGPGYELFPGLGYYKFHPETQVWDDARRTCDQEGAHLAVVNSEEESKVLQQLFGRHPQIKDAKYNDFAFVGFHDRYTEGSFVTIFGEPVSKTGFERWWARGQPDNAGAPPGEDCGSVHRNGGLNDLPCDAKHAFVCEQEPW